MRLRALLWIAHATAVLIADTDSTTGYISRHVDAITPLLADLFQSTDFFKYYRVNLFSRECPYFNEAGAFCGNRACAVDLLEDEDVPEVWRASELGKLRGPSGTAASDLPLQTATSSGGDTCVQDANIASQFCLPEDDGKGDCVYVSLTDNPERYTGYAGSHAHAIWGSIYRENCFAAHSGDNIEKGQSISEENTLGQAHVKLLQVGEHTQCLEKRLFYRIVSGMHASISMHICAEYLNPLSGAWSPNGTCFDQRLRDYPQRINNIFFNYVLLSRAIGKVQPALSHFNYCAGDIQLDKMTSEKVKAVAMRAAEVRFDERPLFVGDEDLKQDFRNRFRNISSLMDCVGCDKCRLWGKVQTAGYGAALKVLVGEAELGLSREELIALFNTYGRLSHSLASLKLFGYPIADDPVSVDDTAIVSEEVISPSARNPHAASTRPRSALARHLDKLRPHLQKVLRITGFGGQSSISGSLIHEVRLFTGALQQLFFLYTSLPRLIWTRLFTNAFEAAQQQPSAWQRVFDVLQAQHQEL
ncbi:endoplasmic oxidoreductin-1 [Savitreella phatthalungensis]